MHARMLGLILVMALIGGASAYAHHSFAATYFEDRIITIEGKLVQFVFRNPHSFVHIEAPDSQGIIQRWAIEWGGAGQLGNQGVARDTLKSGDVVTITANPGRNPTDHRARMLALQRKSDGYSWGRRPGETFD